ncbi:MFS transporter [Micromonospora parathelypteridis]|uniref:MFS family permease n=1 Tax=Micromonospora parathelypteridis TaxID=1839617 RepID=A0A840VZ10_9ACTN|nr:MFS transporter [Micromonospora parathelypteridis]MBB5481206.1 MFS family permease [Micromonospora parathelypteridis]GGO19615.1 MFS transporter [Micromonospora parathelypteridis]
MTHLASRVPDPAVRRLTATLYGYAFLSDLVLLYPLYVVFFADTGLSVGQISSLFVVWSAAGILFEVPSGAWADVVSRRLLLCLAPLVTAAAFALWVLVPSYPAFAVGFLLWGAAGALVSGALEALVWTELDRLGAVGRYARVLGRARTAGVLGVVCSGVLAGPVFAVGGYPVVGAASVLACLFATVVATRFPEHRPSSAEVPGERVSGTAAPADPDDGDLGWWDTLRAGVAQVRTRPPVRAAVLLVAVVTADWGALDEFTPLLALDTGVGAQAVPLLLLLLWAGVTVGGLLAPAGERLSHRGYGALLCLVGVALAGGALLEHPAGFVLLAVAFGAAQLATVLADARLQARITGSSRATVTSMAGMATDVLIIGTYVCFGLLATAAGNAVAFAVTAGPYLIVGLVVLTRHRRTTAAPAGVAAAAATGPD